MSFWIGVLIFVIGILVSVCLHEAGHLLTAKRFGMKVTQYFAGFGPTSGRSGGARPSTASRRSRPAASSRSSG